MIFSDLCKIQIPSADNYLCAIQCTCFHDLLYISVTQRTWRSFSLSIVGLMVDGVDEMSCLMTEPTKWHVLPLKTQIIPVRSESLLFAWRKLESLATHWAHSKDWSDWADALAIWVFPGRTVILLVLYWGGSNHSEKNERKFITLNVIILTLFFQLAASYRPYRH